MHTPNENLTSQVPKVWNGHDAWENLVVFPEATNEIQGDVWLSDSVESDEDAATGITAATPKAVKTVQDNANNKLDKTTGGTVSGATEFTGTLKGELTGNAATASALDHEHTFSVTLGSADKKVFSSKSNLSSSSSTDINVTEVPASLLSGTISVDNLPAGAMDKLVQVADASARHALTTNEVQTGDSVLQQDTQVLYLVVDDTKLTTDDGYQEYKAGTATKALQADKLSSARTLSWTGNATGSVSFDGSQDVSAKLTLASNAVTTTKIKDAAVTTAKIADANVTTAKLADDAVTADKIADSVHYAGSSSNGGNATTADSLALPVALNVSGDVAMSGSMSVTKATGATAYPWKLTATIQDSAITESKLLDSAVTTKKLADGAVTTDKLKDANVTTAKLASSSVTAAKMASTAGVVYVGSTEPTETAYKIWIVTEADTTS